MRVFFAGGLSGGTWSKEMLVIVSPVKTAAVMTWKCGP